MPKLKDLFHEIGNFHNKICVGAGIAKMELARDFKGNLMPLEIKMALGKFKDLEKNAIEASVALNKLKDIVYGTVDLEANRKKDNKGEKIND